MAIYEAMTQRMSKPWQSLGAGLRSTRQYHLDVAGEDIYIDLLLVHVSTNRFVVVELKSGKFRPEHLGQLNFYVSAVNDIVKFPGMAPTVGILVCRLQARSDGPVCTRWLLTTNCCCVVYL